MKISKGIKEDGIVVGNNYDKYNSKNIIAKKLMSGFDSSLSALVRKANTRTIHEVGCGEGVWVIKWNLKGIVARGSDFSEQVINLAKDNAKSNGLTEGLFERKSIYEVNKEQDSAELVVCCEVLEHLEEPQLALDTLKALDSKYYIFSVPREPIWCALNLARGKYIFQLGNTPGHIQHWSKSKFIQFIAKDFKILEIKTPLPWVMVLCEKYTTL